MGESIKRIVGSYQDSYSPNGIIGEKDACGVGFIANIKGIESNWILKQSLKGGEYVQEFIHQHLKNLIQL